MNQTKDNDTNKPLDNIAEKYVKTVEKWINPDRLLSRRKVKPNPDEVHFVGFNDRMFAGSLDTVLSFLILTPIMLAISEYAYRNSNSQELMNQILTQSIDINTLLNSPSTHAFLINNILQMGLIGLIFLGFWIYSSATPGQWILRMRIVDQDTGMHPTTKQFIIRLIATFILPIIGILFGIMLIPVIGLMFGAIASFIFSMLWFIWIIWDKEKQGWHDKISHTVVVKVKHWKIKASTESEFPDSWFEEDTQETEPDKDSYSYDDDAKDGYLFSNESDEKKDIVNSTEIKEKLKDK